MIGIGLCKVGTPIIPLSGRMPPSSAHKTMIIKIEVTEQDFVDIQTINNGLNEASHYIVEIVGKSNSQKLITRQLINSSKKIKFFIIYIKYFDQFN